MTNQHDRKSLYVATQVFSESLEKLVNYLRIFDHELKEHEATLLAAVLLEQLPTVLQSSPELLKHIKEQSDQIKRRTR